MNAINPVLASGTSSEKRSYEPSMEEILASIRRIIADDQGIPARGGQIDGPAAAVEASHELLRIPTPHASEASDPERSQDPPASGEAAAPATLHGIAAHGSIAAPQYPSPDGLIGAETGVTNDIAEAPSAPMPAPSAPLADALEPLCEEAPQEHAEALAAASGEREDESTDEPKGPNPMADHAPLLSASTEAAVSAAFNTLAASRLADNSQELMDIARELIRPMLRAWLDDNLPGLVEGLVRGEIERVARGGGR